MARLDLVMFTARAKGLLRPPATEAVPWAADAAGGFCFFVVESLVAREAALELL